MPKQSIKRRFNNIFRSNFLIRQKYHRNVIICFFIIVLAYPLLHLIQTGQFIIDHYFETEDINDMIKLDMNVWKNNNSFLTRKIPRYIHQIWISSLENKQMDERFRLASESCITLHPNYNYTLWTHKKILIWLENEYPWFLSVYKSYRYDMQRIDAMKYLLLFHFGGIYVDLDLKCLTNDLITAMIPKNQRENEPDIVLHIGTEGISANTDVILAKQYHPFFKLAISRLKAANRWFYLYHLTIILSAGPTYLYGIYRKYPLKANFYFIPNDLLWGKLFHGVGGATWYGNDTLIILFLIQNNIVLWIILFIVIICLFYVFHLLKNRKESIR
ncbi:hypothetical protein I4U23_031317 [Adineta vaga]|nr:hypothetical protein I4U23_031317 [Adineta vaga]